MSSWSAEIRRREAGARREERETRKRHRELERRIKDRARLSELEQARLDVEAYENAVELLLSVHKEQSASVEWQKIASALPPHQPVRSGRHEFAAILQQGLGEFGNTSVSEHDNAEEARRIDEQEHQAALQSYEKEQAEVEHLRTLAKRVLTGEPGAYSEAISELSSLGELSQLGSSIHFTVHSRKLIECVLTVNGRDAIPAEVKTLTAAKKLSVKAMPKARFHEIYQDYVCGCVFRLGREVLALLPADVVLVSASVDGTDLRTGKQAELCVLSVGLTREIMDGLDFDRLDPSDSMENFNHRGEVKASRNGGEFVAIIPLTPADLAPLQPERMDFSDLLKRVRQFREEVSRDLKPLTSTPRGDARKSPSG